MSLLMGIPSAMFIFLKNPQGSRDQAAEMKQVPIKDIFKLLFSRKMMILNL